MPAQRVRPAEERQAQKHSWAVLCGHVRPSDVRCLICATAQPCPMAQGCCLPDRLAKTRRQSKHGGRSHVHLRSCKPCRLSRLRLAARPGGHWQNSLHRPPLCESIARTYCHALHANLLHAHVRLFLRQSVHVRCLHGKVRTSCAKIVSCSVQESVHYLRWLCCTGQRPRPDGQLSPPTTGCRSTTNSIHPSRAATAAIPLRSRARRTGREGRSSPLR